MEIFVTPRAEANFESIVKYIQTKWGEGTAKAFILKVDKLFSMLKNYPMIGQTEQGEIRGFQISKQTRILYRVRDNKVIILAFFDVRQDPVKKFN